MTTGARRANVPAERGTPDGVCHSDEPGWSTRLGPVIASLAAARTLDSLVQVVVTAALAVAGASVATLSAVEDQGANLVAAHRHWHPIGGLVDD